MPLVTRESVQSLNLAPASRRLPNPAGYTTDLKVDGVRQTPVEYLDYLIDGQRLYALITQQVGDLDLVSPMHDRWPKLAIEATSRLLGEAPGDLPTVARPCMSAPSVRAWAAVPSRQTSRSRAKW